MIQRFSSENLITKLYVEPPLLHRVFYINKPAAQAAGLPDAASPIGKVHTFSKIALTLEPVM